MIRLCLTALVLALCIGNPGFTDDLIWAKGNLHTHTTNSDGDSAPQAVADWYKDHGYQFLVISDHERVTDIAPLDKDPNDKFILIPGEELALKGKGLPIHGNAIGISKTVASPARTINLGRSVRNLVEYIRDSGSMPMVNHPNWYQSLAHRELIQIHGSYLMEISNGDGGADRSDNAHYSTEQIWDILLSQGQEVYVTGTDDMHRLKDASGRKSDAGIAWVVARVPELTQSAVLTALSKGEFYASTGVELADCSFDSSEFKVRIAPKADRKYLIRFVGKWGSILQETTGMAASYRIAGKPEPNSYIRCKIIAADGMVAWTQAYRIR